MTPEILEIKAALQIGKPVREVFEAIVDPTQMSNYFISRSSGRMESGTTLHWEFPEFDNSYPVEVDRVEPDRYVSFRWEGAKDHNTLVEIGLEPRENDTTLVRITEGTLPNNEAGIQWLLDNGEGWANFLACLKAWLEFGINLRTGGYDYLKQS